jgi:hypothetical protein
VELLIQNDEEAAMTPQKNYSQLATVVDTLRILNPFNPQDPIDAPLISALTDLTTKQASRYLSLLHRTGYLIRVGTGNHFAQYLRSEKVLPRGSASIGRRYKRMLAAKPQQYHTPSASRIATEVSHNAIAALRYELRRQALLHAVPSQQLSLFKGA